ncbi:glyoxalase/bleomycin resistance protein/dioxygenase superfamily protein [Chromohalobacter marismortui]|uniref:Glyoxalase/bleomycin resistance protein/dioxygenase superfamily protein n=1 Tax=Chromohalobacter marismortui TaxID=42055 RepID=A0A4R7NRM8_9GAMM|nr:MULTISPECIES: VOC family protein [Chromohalobacter]MCI0511329.1 VOC family protein [Chromohalobacter sp.]MCI0594059.1 VOC family protein [Chromohalobacter sp.]TDU23654.1 glyoxalase/bleomycin resistance protein/dioxygenase superfamily protein [Chromohalobacter marismortui]
MLNAIDHLVVNVTDLERSIDFYTRVLGLEARYHDATRADLYLDDFALRLCTVQATADNTQPAMPGNQALGFRSALPLAEVKTHLEVLGVPLDRESDATDRLHVRDPDGNPIEISRPRRR